MITDGTRHAADSRRCRHCHASHLSVRRFYLAISAAIRCRSWRTLFMPLFFCHITPNRLSAYHVSTARTVTLTAMWQTPRQLQYYINNGHTVE